MIYHQLRLLGKFGGYLRLDPAEEEGLEDAV